MRKAFASEECRAHRREVASRLKRSSRRVHCSDGRSFDSVTLAARAVEVRTSSMMHLAKSQHLGRLGVRFRFDCDEWSPIETSSEKNWKARRLNGTVKWMKRCALPLFAWSEGYAHAAE